MADELLTRARRVKMLACDVDGVLTDGRLFMGRDGEAIKAFYAPDGLGLQLARRQGLQVAFISGRDSELVQRRAGEMGIEDVHLGIRDKLARMKKILQGKELSLEQVAYIGDDLNDLELLGQVGLAITVPEGASELRARAHYITGRRGGRGAVREVVELILKSQDRWPY